MASAKEHQLDISEEEQALILMRSLDAMRKEQQNCDIIIKVDDEDIHVHRAVISARSDYFKAMFSHDTAENRSGVVEMKGVGYKFVKKGIEHIYGGKASICEDDCVEFILVATMMQLPFLCGKIEKFLALRLNPTKFFEFKRVAEKFSCKTLKEACYEYASENLGAISKEDGFKDLEMEYILSLMQCKTSSYSEDAKCSVLLQWIKCDAENRKGFLTKIMSVMEFDKISSQYNRYLVENETLCFESLECLRNLYLSVVNKMGTEAAPTRVSFSGSNNSLIVFDKTSKALQAYKPSRKTWTKMHDLHGDLTDSLGYTAVIKDKMLYVLVATKKFLRLEVTEMDAEWEQLPDMLLEHGIYLSATVLDDFIYVAGRNSMERYSIAAHEWERVNSDNVRLNQSGLIAYSDCIYALGGLKEDNFSSLNIVKRYSPASLSWSDASSLLWWAENVAALVHDNNIFAAGGNYMTGNYTYAGRYDIKSNTWSQLPSMIRQRTHFSLCVIGEKVFAVGGNSPQTIEAYNSVTGMWEETTLASGMQIMAPATVALWLPQ